MKKKTKIALITGITGQDGSYLAEFLLSKGYIVHGIIRRASTFNTKRLEHIYVDPHESNRFFLHYGDMADSSLISNIINDVSPDEVYNLGAQSHVRVSFDMPEYTGNITGLGVTRILEAIRRSRKPIKFYQASSSEIFGNSPVPRGETSAFSPRSPYACAKAYGFWMTVNYRQGYNLFACNGIMFNHESPRRGETFVTRKITRGISLILSGQEKFLYLGNLDARRDWGFAPEYVELMWKIMQYPEPDDFVIGTGESHSVREFVEEAFAYAGLDLEEHLKIDQKYFRPTEVEELIADSTKARNKLGWEPRVRFRDLVRIMVDADMREAGLEPIGEGNEILNKVYPDKWWVGD